MYAADKCIVVGVIIVIYDFHMLVCPSECNAIMHTSYIASDFESGYSRIVLYFNG
jgi:hypothetical protein